MQRLVFGRCFGATLSQGLVSLSPADSSLGALFARAGAAMYEAKRGGKNRIVLG